MKKILLVCLTLVFTMATLWAQERTISGKVSSTEDGTTLPGVNVIIKGTTTGTVTDIDGNFRISVPDDGLILQFSFIGLASQEVEIGNRSVIDVQMSADVTELTEVVVTAQGIQREKRALGYAVSTVKADALEKKADADVARILQGKIPGVNITATGGLSGQGSAIIIRGFSSLTGSNQPLFIVDGVPFNSGTNIDEETNGFLQGTVSTSSRFLDLDPNNIESINVLKGLSAATIYGNAGRNGVILVTTKSGRSRGTTAKGFEVSVSQSVFANEIASLPELQDNYGGGFHQNFGFFFSNWGPKFTDPPLLVNHPLSALTDPTLLNQFPAFLPDANGNVPQYEYKAYDNLEEFFRTGMVKNTSVAIAGGNEFATFSANFGYQDEQGFTPNNRLEKINLGLGGNVRLANKLTLSQSFNYVETDYKTPPISFGNGSGISEASGGAGISVFADVFYTPRSVDLNGLPSEAPADHRSVYYRSGNDIQNPNWTIDNAETTDDVRRVYGKTSLTYDITDDINITYRLGIDHYNETQEYVVNRGQVQNATILTGLYRSVFIQNTIYDNSLIVNLTKSINEDLDFTANIGGNARQDQFSRDGIESTNQLVFGFVEHSNFTQHSSVNSFSGVDLQRKVEENLNGVFAAFTFDYRDFLYLNLQGRNDWSSTLEEENNSLFYPGVSASFIPTTALGWESTNFNYLKIRLGYGTSAGFPSPYSTRSTFSGLARAYVGTAGNVVTANNNGTYFDDNGVGSSLGNADLKPERHSEIEFGIEGKFINNRLSVDLTLYDKTTDDLITNAPLDPSTGFTSTTINIGELENKGVELSLNGTPLILGDFRWNVGLNYYTYETEVIDLGADLDQVNISGFTNLGNFAIEGEPFGIMQGGVIDRDADGNMLVDSDGLYVQAGQIGIIGDPNPNYTLTGTSTFSWKGISLFAQIDYRDGGDIYSTTARALLARGLTKDTDFNRDLTMVLPGVKQSDGLPNDIQITSTQAYFDNIGFGPSEVSVWDGTTIRLREVSLGYEIPSSLLENIFVGSINITFSGFNLWYNAVNFPEHTNFDTDVLSLGVGNGQGFDFLNGPSSKRYGGTVKVTF